MTPQQPETGETGMNQELSEETPDAPAIPASAMRFGISPKWQMVVIGGIFIGINIMVMIVFVVALFLRR